MSRKFSIYSDAAASPGSSTTPQSTEGSPLDGAAFVMVNAVESRLGGNTHEKQNSDCVKNTKTPSTSRQENSVNSFMDSQCNGFPLDSANVLKPRSEDEPDTFENRKHVGEENHLKEKINCGQSTTQTESVVLEFSSVSATAPSSTSTQGEVKQQPNIKESAPAENRINFGQLQHHLKTHKKGSSDCAGKTTTIVFGNTGAGKSLFINWVNGKKIIKKRPEGGGRKKLYVDGVCLNEFEVGHSKQSKTYFLKSVSDGKGKVWCDTPGFSDTKDRTVRIAHAVAISFACNSCASVLPVLLVNTKSLGAAKAKGFKELVDLITKFITTNFEENLKSLQIFFTHAGDDGFEEIKGDLEEIMDITVAHESKQLLKHMIGMLDKHKDVLILNPHEENPEQVLSLLAAATPIEKSAHAFGSPLSGQERTDLIIACDTFVKTAVRNLDSHNFKEFTGNLKNLKMIADASQLERIISTYNKLIEKMLNVFHSKLDAANSAMDKNNFSEVKHFMTGVDDNLLKYEDEIKNIVGHQNLKVETRRDDLVQRIQKCAQMWAVDEPSLPSNCIEDFPRLGKNMDLLEPLVNALKSELNDQNCYDISKKRLNKLLEHFNKRAVKKTNGCKFGEAEMDNKLSLKSLLDMLQQASEYAKCHISSKSIEFYPKAVDLLQRKVNEEVKTFLGKLDTALKHGEDSYQEVDVLSNVFSTLSSAKECLSNHVSLNSYDDALVSLGDKIAEHREFALKSFSGKNFDLTRKRIANIHLISDLLNDQTQLHNIQDDVWSRSTSLAKQVSKWIPDGAFAQVAENLKDLSKICTSLETTLNAVRDRKISKKILGQVEKKKEQNEQNEQNEQKREKEQKERKEQNDQSDQSDQSDQNAQNEQNEQNTEKYREKYMDLVAWYRHTESELSSLFLDQCKSASATLTKDVIDFVELSNIFEAITSMWLIRESLSEEARFAFEILTVKYIECCEQQIHHGQQYTEFTVDLTETKLGAEQTKMAANLLADFNAEEVANIFKEFDSHEKILENKNINLNCHIGDIVTKRGFATLATLAKVRSELHNATHLLVQKNQNMTQEALGKKDFENSKLHLDVLENIIIHLDERIKGFASSSKSQMCALMDKVLDNMNTNFQVHVNNNKLDEASVVYDNVVKMSHVIPSMPRIDTVLSTQVNTLDAKKKDFIGICQSHIDDGRYQDLSDVMDGVSSWALGSATAEERTQWNDVLKKLRDLMNSKSNPAFTFLRRIARSRNAQITMDVFENSAKPLYVLLAEFENTNLKDHFNCSSWSIPLQKLHAQILEKIANSAKTKLDDYCYIDYAERKEILQEFCSVGGALGLAAEKVFESVDSLEAQKMSNDGLKKELMSLIKWGYEPSVDGRPQPNCDDDCDEHENVDAASFVDCVSRHDNRNHGNETKETVAMLQNSSTLKTQMSPLSDCTEGNHNCVLVEFFCIVEPYDISKFFSGLEDAIGSDWFPNDRRRLKDVMRNLKNDLRLRVEELYKATRSYAENRHTKEADELHRAYKNLNRSCHDWVQISDRDLDNLALVLKNSQEINPRQILEDPQQAQKMLKKLWCDDLRAFTDKEKSAIEPMISTYEDIRQKIDYLNFEQDSGGRSAMEIIRYLKHVETSSVAFNVSPTPSYLLSELLHYESALFKLFEQQMKNMLSCVIDLRQDETQLQMKHKVSQYIAVVVALLRDSQREKLINLANKFDKEISGILKEVQTVVNGAISNWKQIEEFQIAKNQSASVHDVSKYVLELKANRNFFERTKNRDLETNGGQQISFQTAIDTVKLRLETCLPFDEVDLLQQDGIKLKEFNRTLENLKKMEQLLPETEAQNIYQQLCTGCDNWLRQCDADQVQKYSKLLDIDTYEQEKRGVIFNQIDLRSQQLRRVRTSLKGFGSLIPAVNSSKIDQSIMDLVLKKSNKLGGNPNGDKIAEHLVSLYSLFNKISSKNVKTYIISLMQQKLEKWSKRTENNTQTLALLLEELGTDGTQIVTGGTFNIFQEEEIRRWKKQTAEMTFPKALEGLKRENNSVTEKELEFFGKAWKTYEEAIENCKGKCTFGDAVPVYRLLRKNMGSFKRSPHLKNVPTILGQISAAVAIQLAEKDTNPEALRLPHPVQMLALFQLLGLGKDPTSHGWIDISLFNGHTPYDLQNHLIQISTGEGKSIVLGVLSTFLAMLGYDVDCVCYSKYLSDRDYKSFRGIFENLGIDQFVNYSTFGELSERIIMMDGNVRLGAKRLLEGELKKGDVITQHTGRDRILLIDEVDVFFSNHFYGNLWNPVVTLRSPEMAALLQLIWNGKTNELSVQDVEASSEYTAVDTKYKLQRPNIKKIFLSEISKMICALKTFEDAPHVIQDGRIGIVEHGTVNFKLQCGYNTTWWLFRAKDNKEINQHSLDQATSVGLELRCGQFSYAEIPKSYKHILGVTGTLSALGTFEKKIIKDEYNIKKSTVMPSLYGKRDVNFFQGVQCEEQKDEYYQRILQEILSCRNSSRAVLVFFENEERLFEWKNSDYGKRLEDGEFSIVTKGDVDDIDHYVSKATRPGQITLLPRVFGRGLDFKVFDKKVKGNGGVHVIQTFLSEEKTEEIQIMGRTCRQGANGTYKMILLQDDLLNWKKKPDEPGKPLLTKEELTNPQPTGETKTNSNQHEFKDPLYNLLDTRRQEWFSRLSQERSKTVQNAKAVHLESKRFQRDLVRGSFNIKTKGNIVLRCLKFLQERTLLSGSFHVVFCLDKSGSMAGGSWAALQKAFLSFLQMCNSPGALHAISVVLFNSNSHTAMELESIAVAQNASLGNAGGATNFAPPLNAACEVIQNGLQQRPDLTPLVVFMSDGENHDSGQPTDDALDLLKPMLNDSSHFIFFGTDEGKDYLESMATRIGGNFHVSIDGVALEETFTDIAQNITQHQ